MSDLKLKESKTHTDKNLVIDFYNGCEDAYEHIYRLYFHKIYMFVLRYVVCKDLAYDLTQDIFLKIWEKRDQLTHAKNFQSYLYCMAKNHTLDRLKHISVSKKAIKELALQYENQCKPLDIQYAEKEYFEFLKAEIIDLPERTRIIFKLCREEDKSYKEVAEELGISTDTVKYHMVKSMKTLKCKVSRYFGITIALIFLIL